MGVFLITYDLNNEDSRPNITGDIKKFKSWAKLSESSYAVNTNLSAEAVYNRMKKFLDADDNLYVIGLRKPLVGQGSIKVNKWLETNLPEEG